MRRRVKVHRERLLERIGLDEGRLRAKVLLVVLRLKKINKINK